MEVHRDPQTWNDLITSLPDPHILQTWEWGRVKAGLGWRSHLLVWRAGGGRPEAAALALQRAFPIPGFASLLSVIYVPKGPLLDWGDVPLRRRVLGDLGRHVGRLGALAVKIDPDVRLGAGLPGEPEARDDPAGQAVRAELRQAGWRFSSEQVQFRNTVLIDLTPSEEALLANMKQKTRYNVRLARRRGVLVRTGTPADFDCLYRMYAETAVRDEFAIRERDYYLAAWNTFVEAGMAEPLLAIVEGEPVAGLVLFRLAGKAWFLYGMSRDRHRDKMPSYLLQWEAIRRAKAAGCTVYDMWGAPDDFTEGDPMWGVYRFKQGFGGTVVRHIGAWDFPLRPTLYRLFNYALPRALGWLRGRGLARTRRALQMGE